MFLARPEFGPEVGLGTLDTEFPGSLKDLLLLIELGPGLWDLGTRDLPRKGARDLDFDSEGGAGFVNLSSACSGFFLSPMENMVIFLRVFLSMLPFSGGELLPPESPLLALELTVPEENSLLVTEAAPP